jgi:hypothetical protein
LKDFEPVPKTRPNHVVVADSLAVSVMISSSAPASRSWTGVEHELKGHPRPLAAIGCQ